MPQITEGCLQIRGLVVHSYALLATGSRNVTLIDGGFLGNAIGRIERELSQADRTLQDVETILLTHGHIDHTLNIARLQELTGAPVFAHEADSEHVAGTFAYHGIARFCGLAESLARNLFRFRPPEIERWFQDGELLGNWGGLRVVHLPGHTPGHCGFYSESRKLLIAGDLFANFFRFARRPPPWFKVDGTRIPASIRRANELDLSGGLLLNHCHPGSPSEHREDLRKLAEKISGSP